tara:strand:- start:362 stop:1069 length:708 start_codon:yes stop_codon:yes gene_type:complete
MANDIENENKTPTYFEEEPYSSIDLMVANLSLLFTTIYHPEMGDIANCYGRPVFDILIDDEDDDESFIIDFEAMSDMANTDELEKDSKVAIDLFFQDARNIAEKTESLRESITFYYSDSRIVFDDRYALFDFIVALKDEFGQIYDIDDTHIADKMYDDYMRKSNGKLATVFENQTKANIPAVHQHTLFPTHGDISAMRARNSALMLTMPFFMRDIRLLMEKEDKSLKRANHGYCH